MNKALLLFAVCFYSRCYAQTGDTTVVLPELEILSGPTTELTIDSVGARHRISESITSLAIITGKADVSAYGPEGSSAQIRLLGASSDHTSFVWNGCNINSPSLGTCDISLIPLFFFENISIAGNGNNFTPAIGGSIDLSGVSSQEKNSARLYAGVNSLHNSWLGFSLQQIKKKITSSARVFASQAENKFVFRDIYYPGERKIEQINNNSRAAGLLHQLSYQFKPSHTFHFDTWCQGRKSELPSTMGGNSSFQSSQVDVFARNVLGWKWKGVRLEAKTRAALFLDQQHFRQWNSKNGAEQVRGDMNSIMSNLNSIVRYRISHNSQLETGLSLSSIRLKGNNLSNGNADDQFLNSFVLCKWNPWKLGFWWRAWTEVRSNSILVSGEFNQEWKLKLSRAIGCDIMIGVAHLNRHPDMNERFWLPGGNESLRPEISDAFTSGYKIKLNRTNYSINLNSKLFAGTVRDWIQWVPTSDGWWVPKNEKLVRRFGLENELKIEWGNKWKKSITLFYGFSNVNSIVTNATGESLVSMPYIPKHKSTLNCIITHKRQSFFVSIRYLGERFTNESAEVAYVLPANLIADVSWMNTLKIGSVSSELTVGVANLFNTQYQLIRSYALPGRVFRVMISVPVSFPSKTNKQP